MSLNDEEELNTIIEPARELVKVIEDLVTK